MDYLPLNSYIRYVTYSNYGNSLELIKPMACEKPLIFYLLLKQPCLY